MGKNFALVFLLLIVFSTMSFLYAQSSHISQKITYVRGAFQGDCNSLYVFDGAEASFDSLYHTFTFRVSGSYKGKYLGSYECIIPFAKVDSTVVLRIQDDDCIKQYLLKPALYRVELRFKNEDVSLRTYGSPLPESFDQIYLYFFSAYEAYDFDKVVKRLKNN